MTKQHFLHYNCEMILMNITESMQELTLKVPLNYVLVTVKIKFNHIFFNCLQFWCQVNLCVEINKKYFPLEKLSFY